MTTKTPEKKKKQHVAGSSTPATTDFLDTPHAGESLIPTPEEARMRNLLKKASEEGVE